MFVLNANGWATQSGYPVDMFRLAGIIQHLAVKCITCLDAVFFLGFFVGFLPAARVVQEGFDAFDGFGVKRARGLGFSQNIPPCT